MLYALRYETHSNNDINRLVDTLRRRGVDDKYIKVWLVSGGGGKG